MIKNSTAGKRFFGKHFWPGVAEYKEGEHAMRILINEDTIRKMNPSFEGKPVFVKHVEDVIDKPIDELKQEADGWVIRSFYNEADGDTWAEFIVVSQKGIDAINSGWKLSNAYLKKQTDARRGLWNGVEYDEQILDGEFEHLAIVNNPRYAQSVILTPEEFKKYNEDKKAELLRLQNSLKQEPQKLESKMPFNFFKKSKVENGIDLEGLSVMLPKTGREAALVDLINEADVELKEIKDQIITVNEEKDEHMTIEEAVKEINALRNKCNELEEKLKDKKDNEDDKKPEEKKDNEDKKEEEKKENECGKQDNECEKKNEEDKKDEDKKDNEDDKKEDDKKDNADEEEKEKKLEETEKKTEELVKKNFLNEILNAQQVCANDAGHQDILLPADRAELAKKYF